jgi:hypothetical protein
MAIKWSTVVQFAMGEKTAPNLLQFALSFDINISFVNTTKDLRKSSYPNVYIYQG